jgi:adenosylcobinamide-GDP ribazoletransferase
MATLNYVTDPDKSKSKPVADGFSTARLLAAVGFVMVLTGTLSFWQPFLITGTLAAVLLVALFWGAYLKRQLGGYTGDALGASVVLSELVLLLFL